MPKEQWVLLFIVETIFLTTAIILIYLGLRNNTRVKSRVVAKTGDPYSESVWISAGMCFDLVLPGLRLCHLDVIKVGKTRARVRIAFFNEKSPYGDSGEYYASIEDLQRVFGKESDFGGLKLYSDERPSTLWLIPAVYMLCIHERGLCEATCDSDHCAILESLKPLRQFKEGLVGNVLPHINQLARR